jgi:hypothetical protein
VSSTTVRVPTWNQTVRPQRRALVQIAAVVAADVVETAEPFVEIVPDVQ